MRSTTQWSTAAANHCTVAPKIFEPYADGSAIRLSRRSRSAVVSSLRHPVPSASASALAQALCDPRSATFAWRPGSLRARSPLLVAARSRPVRVCTRPPDLTSHGPRSGRALQCPGLTGTGTGAGTESSVLCENARLAGPVPHAVVEQLRGLGVDEHRAAQQLVASVAVAVDRAHVVVANLRQLEVDDGGGVEGDRVDAP